MAREELIDAAAIEPLLSAAAPESAGGSAVALDAAVVGWLGEQRPAPGQVYDSALAAFERPLFIEALRQTGGNQLRAAQNLGINRNTLRKRLTELGIEPVLLQH